ncbi:MAG TPA: AsmA family protein, partial [Rudaea sp.]|nr:AsmA family protein [Rudaea sp.]
KPPRSEPEGYAFGWTAQGRMRGAEVKGEGRIGSVLALRNPERPFPLQADVHFGDTRVAFVGTLTDPRDLDALDLHLWLSGTTLSELYDVLGVTMPESGPYATSGQLIGNFRDATKLHYKNFTARVGESDLDGDLTYEVKKPRPLLSGKVVSNLLQFGDLAPLIGSSKKAAPQADQASSKVLPEEPFRPERWKVMDADVQFTGDRVFRDSELPIHKLVTRIVMKDAVLTLDPLRFRFAYGDVDGRIRMDGTNAPIKGAINGSARGVQLKHLFKTADSSQLDLGNANATIDLSASGNSVGALLGAANGEVKALLDGGSISKELVETAALNVPNIVLAKLVGDRQIRIGCAAADFAASNGVYNARLFIIDTDAAQINVTGDVDLAHERLDLVVHPDSKGLRLLSLRSPIHITGPFRKPDIGIDKGVLLARSAGAIGLAVVAAPAAALLPLTSTNLGNDQDHCTPLLNAIQQPVEKRAQGVQKSPAAR